MTGGRSPNGVGNFSGFGWSIDGPERRTGSVPGYPTSKRETLVLISSSQLVFEPASDIKSSVQPLSRGGEKPKEDVYARERSLDAAWSWTWSSRPMTVRQAVLRTSVVRIQEQEEGKLGRGRRSEVSVGGITFRTVVDHDAYVIVRDQHYDYVINGAPQLGSL